MRIAVGKKLLLFIIISGISGFVGYNVFIKKDTNSQTLGAMMRNNTAATLPQQQQQASVALQPSISVINDDDSFLETVNQEKKKQILAKLKSETIKYSVEEKKNNKELNSFDVDTLVGTIMPGQGDKKSKTDKTDVSVIDLPKKILPDISLLAINYAARSATLSVNTHPVMIGEGGVVENMSIKKVLKNAVILMDGEQERTIYLSWGKPGGKQDK